MLFRNHEVWIAYDGVQAVPELAPSIPGARDPSTNMATAYLMSEKDKVFSVNWRHLVPQSLLSISIRMDGVLVHQHVSMRGTDGGQLCGVVSGANSIRPFVFSNVPRLQYTDSQLASADAMARRDFGTIRVTIVPIYYVQSTPTLTFVGGPLCGNVNPSPRSDMHCISLHDEVASGVGGGPSSTIPSMPPFDMHLMNDEAVIFEFRYGPLVCLQNIGVVPARTVVAESGPANASPLRSSPSMLGKRSRSQYEDISSLNKEAETTSGAAADKGKGIRTLLPSIL